jgi:hypothetical protein
MDERLAWAKAAPRPGQEVAAQAVIYPDGAHILSNLWHQARPLVAAWLAETL